MNELNLIAIDPSYRRTGAYLVQFKDNIPIRINAYLIENKCSQDNEDRFLYSMCKSIKDILGNDKYHMLIEYTFVPRIKPMMLINRVIGAILGTLHEKLLGWQEISMVSIYSKHGLNRKGIKSDERKKVLRQKLLKSIVTDSYGLIFLDKITIMDHASTLYVEKVTPEQLPQDCIDAYALIDYILKEEVK